MPNKEAIATQLGIPPNDPEFEYMMHKAGLSATENPENGSEADTRTVAITLELPRYIRRELNVLGRADKPQPNVAIELACQLYPWLATFLNIAHQATKEHTEKETIKTMYENLFTNGE